MSSAPHATIFGDQQQHAVEPSSTVPLGDALPITDRLIAALPGSRAVWAATWSAVVLLRPVVASIVLVASGRSADAGPVLAVHLPHNVVLAFITLLALVGTHRLARDGSRALASVGRADQAPPESPDRRIRGMGSVAGPLGIAAILVAAEAASPMVAASPLANVIDDAFFFAFALPIATWIWTYGAVLVSIDRLGRESLGLEAFPVDRGLGLLGVGSVPFQSFWLFAFAALLNFVFVARDLMGYAMGLGVFTIVLFAHVVSFWRLHLQMALAKARYVDEARRLLLEASEPFRRDPSLESLAAQAQRLAAAEAFEKRASDLLEWPIDERLVTRTVLIATGALAGLIARIVATMLGT